VILCGRLLWTVPNAPDSNFSGYQIPDNRRVSDTNSPTHSSTHVTNTDFFTVLVNTEGLNCRVIARSY